MNCATKECFKCGANMVQRYAPGICMSSPPQREVQWWCRCGNEIRIRYERIPGYNEESPWARDWRAANPDSGVKE